MAAVVLLLNAGHEASVNVFGNGLVAMLRRGLRPGADVRADRRGDAALRLARCSCSSAPRPRTSRSAASWSRRARRSRRCSGAANRDPAVFDRAGRRSTWTATPTRTWPSASACTSASARRWRGWSWSSRLTALFAAFPDLELAGEPESRGTFVLRGFRSGPREEVHHA